MSRTKLGLGLGLGLEMHKTINRRARRPLPAADGGVRRFFCIANPNPIPRLVREGRF